MMRVTIRLLTAIALIVISGITVAQSWGIVRFFLASTNIVSSEKRARTADAWRATSGVISTALNVELAMKPTSLTSSQRIASVSSPRQFSRSSRCLRGIGSHYQGRS